MLSRSQCRHWITVSCNTPVHSVKPLIPVHMDNQGGGSKLFWNLSCLPTSTASYHRKLDSISITLWQFQISQKKNVYYKYGCDRRQSWTELKAFSVSNCNRNSEEDGIIMKAAMLIKALRTNGFKYLGNYDRLLNKWGCKRLNFYGLSLKLQWP
jgi:hypothetical protein